MTETEIAVKLENHDQQIKSLKHRMDEQEEQNKTTQELVLTVKELALNMQAMIKAQGAQGELLDKQGERLERLEAEPGNWWNTMSRTLFTSAISAIGGVLAAAIIMAAANYI